jgi:hypothetical protein
MGFCSEYDALPGIGHACGELECPFHSCPGQKELFELRTSFPALICKGHNLIAIAGLGAFLATIEAMKRHDIPGKVVLIGTPAEEGGGGKNELIKMGACGSSFVPLPLHLRSKVGQGSRHPLLTASLLFAYSQGAGRLHDDTSRSWTCSLWFDRRLARYSSRQRLLPRQDCSCCRCSLVRNSSLLCASDRQG